MDDSHIHIKDETAWYENEQPIREYLKSSEKPADNKKEDCRSEKSSWREMMKKSLHT